MQRTPTTNPFEPGSDRIPQVWAGRQEQLADWRDRLRPRRVAGQYERGRTFLGEPGIGKSVLVRRLANDASHQGDWVTPQVRVPRGVNPLPLVAESVLDLAEQAELPSRREQRIGELLAQVRELSVMGSGVRLERSAGPPPHTALTDLLVEVSRAAADGGRVVVVHIDEVQNVGDSEALSQLLVALGDALAHEETREVPGGALEISLPLVVYLTGLPEFLDQASTESGATFARRFATTLLEPISDDDLETALLPFVTEGWPVTTPEGVARVTMAPAAAATIVDTCHGDPFLFQLAGQHAWDAGDGMKVTREEAVRGWKRARPEARRHVERQLDRLPRNERSMVEVMATLQPPARTATRIAREMGYERASQIGPTAQRLDTIRGIISRGSPYSFRHRAVEAYLTSEWP